MRPPMPLLLPLVLGAVGHDVAVLHQRLLVLGIEVSANELREDRFGTGTERALRAYQEQHGLLATGVLDEATARALTISGYRPLAIHGVVSAPDGTPVTELDVRLFDRGVQSEELVAETRSGPDGTFTFAWPAQLVSLTVRATGCAPQEVLASDSPSSKNAWVRLTQGGEFRGSTRFAALMTAVQRKIASNTLHTIGAAGNEKELQSLAESAGIPGEDVSRLVLAHKLSVSTSIAPAVFFALFAQRVPRELTSAFELVDGAPRTHDATQSAYVRDLIAQVRDENIAVALDAAAAAHLIDGAGLATAKQQLRALRIDHIASHPFRIAKTPLRDVLATVLSSTTAQAAVFEAVAAHGTGEALLAAIDQLPQLTTAQRADVHFTLVVSPAIRHHLPLLNHIKQLRQGNTVTAPRDLARFDATDWKAKILQTDPAGASINFLSNLSTAAERIEHFSRLLAAQFEDDYPTAAFAGRMGKHLGSLGLSAAAGVQQFLLGNPDFDLREMHIDRYLKDQPTVLATLPVVADLKKVQRISKLTKVFEQAKALLAAGHNSAYSIYSGGAQQLASTLALTGQEDAAAQIYANAEHAHASTLTLLGNFNSSFTGVVPRAVSQATSPQTMQTMLAGFPSLQTLFGSNDYCACEHCRSIHGPASYLVDILQFLNSRHASGGNTARGILTARRPDLVAIELSCDNTNGVLPYVDLVCEILEDAVAVPAAGAVRARQTTGTEQERRAAPRFVNQAAYDTLRAAVFPASAPFDLWTAEVRTFLSLAGVERRELMTAFQVPGNPASPTDTQIAGETLGFHPNALVLVTTASPTQPWTHWGLMESTNSVPDPRKPDDASSIVSGTWLQVLAYVPIFLHRASVSHRELVQLLATRFINPTNAIRIVATGVDGFATCDSGKHSITGWTTDALSRFTRFLRLWRQLRCPIWDLDKALMAAGVGAGTLDGNAVVQLAKLRQLSARLALPWDELLSFWAPLDRFAYVNVLDEREPVVPSVYAQRFRGPTVAQSSSVFVEDPTLLQGLLGSSEAMAGIAAALDLPVAEVQRVRVVVGLGASDAALTHANLTTLFRYAALARALRLDVAELAVLLEVSGVNPFQSPAKALELLAALDEVRASSFSLRELHYLLRHGSVIESGIALSDSTIGAWLDGLRKELVRLGALSADFVVRQISDLLSLAPELVQQATRATIPGASSSIAAQFADERLVARDPANAFVHPSTRTSFPGVFDAFVALYKLSALISRWRVAGRDALWLLQHSAEAGWLSLTAFPVSAAATAVTLEKLAVVRSNLMLQQSLVSASEQRFFDVVTQRSAPRATVISALSALGGWTVADLTAIADRLSWTTGAALVTDRNAAKLRDLLALARQLGTDVAETLTFVANALTASEARRAQQLAKARFELEKWYAAAASVQNELREQKRAALVAWLLANPSAARGQRWTNIEQLYGHYLIDPEMSPCAATTRIKQAAATVQLFAQRCLMQLEPLVIIDEINDTWRDWSWMKSFRLWEANRKIFLYPENWIDPAQRADKSEIFANLETELQQRDATQETAEDALLAYLQSLNEIANLEVCAVCEEPGGAADTLHVVARTRKTPHVHYHRSRSGAGIWSPWEKLDVAVNAEHVVLTFWNRRLFVFWIEFSKKSLPATSESRRVPSGGGGYAAEAKKYWEIQLSWTEHRSGRWLPKRASKRKQLFIGSISTTNGGLAPIVTGQFVLKSSVANRTLDVDLYRQAAPRLVQNVARWTMSADSDELSLYHAQLSELNEVEDRTYIQVLSAPKPNLVAATGFGWDHNWLQDAPPRWMPLEVLAGSPLQDIRLLSTVEGPTLMVNHQTTQFVSDTPFFVSDPRRTFVVDPTMVQVGYSGSGPDLLKYAFSSFVHPFTGTFLQQLASEGVKGVYDRGLQRNPQSYRGGPAYSFPQEYIPTPMVLASAEHPHPVEDIDYSQRGAYSQYNWELFFHAPLFIAKKLVENQRFEEAFRWFHFIFNPTAAAGGSVPQRYWIPKIFSDLAAPDYAQQQIEALMRLVSQGNADLLARIAAWRANPFNPHLVAASRPVAYQKALVQQYIEALIAWGDQLFRRDTIESINEATQLYLLASELLGPRPQNLRAQQPRVAKTYSEIATQLDGFSNAVVDIENVISVPPPGTPTSTTPLPQLHTFYFCIPPNDKLLSLWDTVGERLFKVRHCMNLQGQVRQLSPYDAPLDPSLLARMAASGVQLSDAISDTDVSLCAYRFTTVWQRAYELCQDVRSLGSSVLNALERRDGEELSRVRAVQEVNLLQAIRAVRAHQLDEAQASREALRSSRDAAAVRREYYGSREAINALETIALALGGQALTAEAAATISDLLAVNAHALPNVAAGSAGFGGTPMITATHGGESLGNSAAAAATALKSIAATLSHGSSLAATVAGYQRRSEDWDLQLRIAERDIEQLDHQLVAADLRIAICQRELDVHDRQTDDARVMSELMATKFTNRELFDWLLSQISTTYFQSYQLAYDLARRAAKSYAFELGTNDPGFIQFGTWDSLHKGLNAGDKLMLDLRRLQTEHMLRNHRELELTKHVSLLQLDPMALVKLRQTGECFINLPESLFDLDQPGHYLRRLKTVSVTLPCVTGPYTGVNATLTLLSHATRRSEVPGPQYLPAVDADGIPLASDSRFSRGSGAVQSVALSTGNQDSGLFEVNFHDERYLPFEGLGAVGHWRLELPKDCNRFDVSTLSDVVMHLRYTARDGGTALRSAARQAVTAALPRSGTRLFSARSEAPDAWARLWAPTGSGQRFDFALGVQHFPRLAANQQLKIQFVSAFLLFEDEALYAQYQTAGAAAHLKVRLGNAPSEEAPPTTSVTFSPDAALAQLPATTAVVLNAPVAPLTLAFLEEDLATAPLLTQTQAGPGGTTLHRLRRDRIEDVLILVSYKIEVRS